MTIDTSKLRGRHVYLEKLGEHHREPLRPLAKDERIWEYTRWLSIDDTFDQQFDEYFSTALNKDAMGGQQAFAMYTTAGRLLGMTRYLNISEKDKRLGIGFTWYIPEVWGKVYNKECKLLMLQYAFEELKFNRVEFNVAGQNIRSQKAVEKIGAVKEGILRKHGYRNDGVIRDVVVYSIINDEWTVNKEMLIRLVAAEENV